MSIILAATWHPRGEQVRFGRLLPVLLEAYAESVIVVPPEITHETLAEIEQLISHAGGSQLVKIVVSPEWSWGRYLAIQASLDCKGDVVHYNDLDRLLRWIETRPEEWRQILMTLARYDCLLIGRSPAAYQTHPQALVLTEAISNRVGSYFLGQAADFSAGSKSFSRKAAEFLVAQSKPGASLGTDSEWILLLRRAGFRIQVTQVDGLDWESADRYLYQAALAEQQQQAAFEYDRDPNHWAYRTEVAQEIVNSALQAISRPFTFAEDNLFDFEGVFEVDDYMYFYRDMLSPERTAKEVEFLEKELSLEDPMTILDLACGFGRHANLLAAKGHRVTGIDITARFLDIARRSAAELGVAVEYLEGDMRSFQYKNKFDRVLCLFTAFGYFNDTENFQVLLNVACALKSGGLLALDIQDRDTLLKTLVPYVVTEIDGNLMIDRMHFDNRTGRLTNRRIVIRDGMRRDKPFFLRMYNANEIEELLLKAGLEVVKIFGGWDGAAISPQTRRMVIIAKKL